MAGTLGAPLEERAPNVLEKTFAYIVPDIHNRINRQMHETFLTGINASPDEYNRAMDAYFLGQNAGDYRTTERVFSNIAALKTPDELLSGLESSMPGKDQLWSIFREDEAARLALHESISKDSSVFYAIRDLAEFSTGIDSDAFYASLSTPEGRQALTETLTRIGNEDALNGAALMPSLAEQGVSLEVRADVVQASQQAFVMSLTGSENHWFTSIPNPNEEMRYIIDASSEDEQNARVREVIGNKTPAQLLNAFEAASPDAKPMLDIIRQDNGLSEAIHTAVTQDSTVLAGLETLIGPGSSLGPDALAKVLADGQTRQGVITMLEQTGTDPELTFEDLSNAIESGAAFQQNPNAPGAADRYKSALARFGLQDNNRIMMAQLMADPGAAMMQMIQDPHTFFANIRAALGNIAPGGLVDGLLTSVEHGIASWTQDPQIHSFMQQYNVAAGVQEFQNVQANLGIRPIDPAVQAMNDDIVRGAANGAPVGNNSVQVTVGGPSVLTGQYGPNALGVVPAGDTADVAATHLRNQGNDNVRVDNVVNSGPGM